MTTAEADIIKSLSHASWTQQKQEHEEKVDALIGSYLENRSRQVKEPVMDFLFEYYHFRPSQLRKWSPGINHYLEVENPDTLPDHKELKIQDGFALLDVSLLNDKRRKAAHWILELLKNSASKKPAFGCFGMHEWAMVYKSELPRHQQVPLRMSREDLAAFVDSRPLVCTHFDAFRFFTKDAQPMNKFELSRDNFIDMEQPGCIHSNMDLYKWAFKMYPWIPSSLILDAFEIASEARYIDMKASPYDLSDAGLDPIRIETEEGRREYLAAQESIFKKAAPIRNKLIEAYEQLLS